MERALALGATRVDVGQGPDVTWVVLLRDGRCSIYEHRPRTCRTYDCRVFTALGVDPHDPTGAIARQARRWRFSFATDEDRDRQAAIRAAGSITAFLDTR